MADLTIESLSIEISAEAQSAINTTKRLTEKLRQLKQATSGGLAGAAEFAKGMREIASAARSLNNVDDTKLKNTAEALKALSSLRNVGDLTNTAAQMKNLKKITESINSMPLIGQDKLQNIRDISTALSSLSSIPAMPDLSGVARSVSQLTAAAAAIQQTNMGDFSHKIKDLAKALRPLTTLGKTNLSSFINSLRRLPEITAALSSMDMGAFAAQIQRVSTAIAPLITQLNTLSTSLNSLPQPLQRAVAGLMNYNTGAQQAGNTTNNLLGKIKNLLNIGAIYATLRRLKSVLGGMVESSNAYVENLNLFTVSMGNAADEALNFANRVNQLMGIDVSQWIENQGYFKQIASGFGVVEDKANLMSQNLTQLGYDISSFYNISVESAMQKLQSGISGEIMPLRSLGYALDEATLKQVAYNHGITESLTNMSQAQKSQIRYLAIMEQSKNALGDMARTIESPANQLRIFSQRVDQLKRAIGNGLMPIISAALPYVTALVRMLTEGAQKIADFLGFEIPVFDYGDLIAAQNADISSSFDEATSAAKEFQGSLSSIDQLNIIGDKAKSSAADGLGGLYDLNIDLPSYDFLGGLSEQADDAYNTLKSFGEKIKPIMAAIAGAFIGYKAVQAVQFFGNLSTAIAKALPKISKFAPVMIALGTAVGVFVGFKNSISNLIRGTGDLGSNIVTLGISLAATVGVVTAFIHFGNPLGALIVGIGAGLGIIVGAMEGISKAAEAKAAEKIAAAFERGETPITEVAEALEKISINLTSSENDYLTAQQNLDNIATNAKTAGEQIQNMINSLKGVGELSSGEIETMKQAFEDLATASKAYIEESNNNFKLYILANQDMLKSQGYSVSEMVKIINSGTENALDDIEKLKQRADELTDLQANYGLDTNQIAGLESINRQLLEMSGVELDLGIDVSEAQKVLDSLSSIKFGDPQNAAEGIERAIDAVTSAFSTLYTTKSDIMLQIESLYDVNDEDKEWLNQAMSSFFELKEKDLTEAFAPSLQKIFSQADSLGLSILAAKAQETTDKSWLGLFTEEYRDAVFEGKSFEQIAKEKARKELGETASIIFDPTEILHLKLAERGLPSSVADMLLNSSKEAGINVGTGVANGIRESENESINAISDLAQATNEQFRIDTDQHSPSRLYAEYGKNLVSGLAIGISNNSYIATNAIRYLSQNLSENMKDISGMNVSIPQYSEEDFQRIIYGEVTMAYPSINKMGEPNGYDPKTIEEVGRIWNSGEKVIDVHVNLNSTVEMDGAEVGYAVSEYLNNQMVYSNGIAK